MTQLCLSLTSWSWKTAQQTHCLLLRDPPSFKTSLVAWSRTLLTHWFTEPVIQALEKLLRNFRLSSYFLHIAQYRDATWRLSHWRSQSQDSVWWSLSYILLLPLVKCGLHYLVLACLPPRACYFTPILLVSGHFVRSAVNVNRYYA